MKNLKQVNKEIVKKNKKLNNIKNIVLYFICIIIIIYNILFQINSINNKQYVQLFNLYIAVINDNSMSPELNKNTLVIGRKIQEKNIEINNIIGFDINGILQFHRLVRINNDNDGKTTYITKADNNYNVDIEEKELEQIKAQIVLKVPIIGIMFSFFQTKIATILIMILLILKFIINKKKINLSKRRKNKKIKMDNYYNSKNT